MTPSARPLRSRRQVARLAWTRWCACMLGQRLASCCPAFAIPSIASRSFSSSAYSSLTGRRSRQRTAAATALFTGSVVLTVAAAATASSAWWSARRPAMSMSAAGNSRKYDYIILGGGNAAGYAARQFVEKHGVAPHSLAIVSAEAVAPYERPALSKAFLAPESPARLPGFHTCVGAGGERQLPEWYEKHGVDLLLSTEIVRADVKQKTLTARDGQQMQYDKLMVAVGSGVVRLSDFGTPGAELGGIHYLREVADAERLYAAMKEAENQEAVVIGGGYIAHDAAPVHARHRAALREGVPRPRYQVCQGQAGAVAVRRGRQWPGDARAPEGWHGVAGAAGGGGGGRATALGTVQRLAGAGDGRHQGERAASDIGSVGVLRGRHGRVPAEDVRQSDDASGARGACTRPSVQLFVEVLGRHAQGREDDRGRHDGPEAGGSVDRPGQQSGGHVHRERHRSRGEETEGVGAASAQGRCDGRRGGRGQRRRGRLAGCAAQRGERFGLRREECARAAAAATTTPGCARWERSKAWHAVAECPVKASVWTAVGRHLSPSIHAVGDIDMLVYTHRHRNTQTLTRTETHRH
eukprot:ctg_897.g373